MSAPDVDQALERLLAATRDATQADADARARIRAALAAQLAAGALAKGAATATRGLGAKLWLLSALGLAGAIGLGAALRRGPAPATNVADRAAHVSALVVVPPPSVVATSPGSVPPPGAAAPPPSAVPAAVSSGAAAVSAQPGASAPRPAPGAADPGAELEIISRMQLALRSGDAPRALSAASEHAHRFPSGALSEERESGRAIAQCWLATPEERAKVLAAFSRSYRSSQYGARVKAACKA
jgi:hypothetical protein